MTSEAATKPISLWKHRDFMLLWSGQTVSDLGSQISSLALPLLAVLALKATTFEVSLLSFLSSLAFLLISLPAGVIVDRVAKRRMMLWCDVARMVLMGSIPVAAVFWHVTLWQLYVVAGTVGVLTVFFDVSYQSYLPFLVDKSQLVDGNGKLGTTSELAQLSGPSIGGALVGAIGAARTVSADAASYAVSFLSLALIRHPEPRPELKEGAARVTFRAAMHEGLSFVVRHPILRKIVACTGTANFFNTAMSSVGVVFLVRTLHATATEVGLVFTLSSVGGLIGGLTAGWFGRRIGTARVIWVSILVPGPLYLLMPLASPGWGLALYGLGSSAISFSALVYNTAQLSYRQSICPTQLLGRMNASVRWIVWGTMPLGALLGGLLGTTVGLRGTIWVGVLGSWIAGLWVLFSPLRKLRDVPET